MTSSHVGAVLFEELTRPNLLDIHDTIKKSSNFSTVLFFQRTDFSLFKRKNFVIGWKSPHQEEPFLITFQVL